MKKQRIMSLLLAFAMVFSLLPASAMAAKTENFTDVSKDDWFYKYVDFVADRGYFVGTSDTTFSPEMPMTRAMFVVVLAALEGAKVNNNVSPFADVPANTWYSGAVKWAADNGVVAGIGDNKFAPDTAISREQMAVMMKAYVEWHSDKTGKIHKEKSHVDSFKDADKVASWAAKAVEDCRAWGLIAGAPDGNFYPQNTATRAEVATVIYNLAWMVLGGGGGGGGHTCVDTNNDHKCDKCGATMGGACADADNDHKCDYCGEKLSDCADANDDHKCDVCGEKISDCADANDDHKCDVCGEKISDCADADDDHICDVCGEKCSDCVDANGDHICDVCGECMGDCIDADENGHCDVCDKCLVEDLIFNALTASMDDVKAGLKAQGKLIADASELDEVVLAALDKIGALDKIETGSGYIKVGGDNTFAKVTAVNLTTPNDCFSTEHAISVDSVLKLETSTVKNIVDVYALTYEEAVTAAKVLAAGAGFAADLTKEEAIAIAQEIADKFEEITGIPVAKATIEKAVDTLMAAPADGMAFASTVWTENFKNENGYITGNVTFSVNDTEVVVNVDDENGAYMTDSKKEAVIDMAVAIAKALYGEIKAASNGEWVTLPEMGELAVTVGVEFSASQNDNAYDTNHFAYEYPVTFSFAFAGDAFDYVEYKFDDVNNVKVTVPEKVQDLCVEAANKLLKRVVALKFDDMFSAPEYLGLSKAELAALLTPADVELILAESMPANYYTKIVEMGLTDYVVALVLDSLDPEAGYITDAVNAQLVDAVLAAKASSVAKLLSTETVQNAIADNDKLVAASDIFASVLNKIGDLCLADFAGEGQDITVTVREKSVTFGLAIEF